MKRYLFATLAASAVVAPALALAGNATAAPSGTSATSTVQQLRSQGYNVQINGSRNGPLTNCSVNAVREMSNDPLRTVFVDLSCPHEYIDD